MRGKLEDMRNNLKVNGNCSEFSKLQVNENANPPAMLGRIV